MWRVTWRNLLARKVRLLLSAFAIVLGVAFVAGLDDLHRRDGRRLRRHHRGLHRRRRGAPTRAPTTSTPGRTTAPSRRRVVRRPRGAARGRRPSTRRTPPDRLRDRQGRQGDRRQRPARPGVQLHRRRVAHRQADPQLDQGRAARRADEVALDVDTAEKGGFDLGDTVTLATPGRPPAMEATLTGLVEFGSGGLNGATLTIFDTAFMQEQFFGGKDVYTSVSLNAADGVSQQQLADGRPEGAADRASWRGPATRLRRGEPGDTSTRSSASSRPSCWSSPAVSLVVGIFLIINTFSILVAQRSRELALLRALGASRRQVNRSVLAEALVVGCVGSTVGLGVGYLLALGLRWLFGAFGLDLSRADFPVHLARPWPGRTASALVVTAIAARASPPAAPPGSHRSPRCVTTWRCRSRRCGGASLVGTVLVVVGGGADGARADRGDGNVGPGRHRRRDPARPGRRGQHEPGHRPAGAAACSARSTAGCSARSGALAAQNALRNPRRTAATASALMIGLALMAMMSIFGSSASASTDAAIGKTLTSQFIVSNVVGQPFSPDVAAQIARLDGVAGVTQLRSAFPELKGGGSAWTVGVDPKALRRSPSRSPPWPARSPTSARARWRSPRQQAKSKGYKVGDTVTMKFQAKDIKLRGGRASSRAARRPGRLRRHARHPGARAASRRWTRWCCVTKEPGAEHRRGPRRDRGGRQGPARP